MANNSGSIPDAHCRVCDLIWGGDRLEDGRCPNCIEDGVDTPEQARWMGIYQDALMREQDAASERSHAAEELASLGVYVDA